MRRLSKPLLAAIALFLPDCGEPRAEVRPVAFPNTRWIKTGGAQSDIIVRGRGPKPVPKGSQLEDAAQTHVR
jgi:hypothetical protein